MPISKMASEIVKKSSKFRLENNVFISATEEINASELQEFVVDLVSKGVLPSRTIFYLIGGIHHGMSQNDKVIEGQTDFTLLHGFYHKLYSKLFRLDIWDKMKYDFVLVPITCIEEPNLKTWETTYKLSDISKRELEKLARTLLKGKTPSLVIFASCFSFDSMIKDILYSKGVMASLSISYDKGEISEGKMFSLDQDQQDVIKNYYEVKPTCILYFCYTNEIIHN